MGLIFFTKHRSCSHLWARDDWWSMKSFWSEDQYFFTAFYGEIFLVLLIFIYWREIIDLWWGCCWKVSFGFGSNRAAGRREVSRGGLPGSSSRFRNYALFYVISKVLLEHFWGHVLCTSAERVGHIFIHNFRKTVISQADMPFVIYNDILGF